MSLNAKEISAVLTELEQLLGQRLRKVSQRDESTLLLQTSRAILCLSCHDRASRIHLASTLPKRIPAKGFCLQLRRRLTGAALTDVSQSPGDRLVRISFGDGSLQLCAELTGRHGNMFLLEQETIRGSLRPNRSHKRNLLPGQRYPGLLPHPPREETSRFDPSQPSLSIAAHYEPLLEAWRTEALLAEVAGPVRRELRSRRRLLQNLRADGDTHRARLVGQRFGDLLLANVPQIPRKAAQITLADLFVDAADPPPVTIPLDPRLSAAENAQRYYRQASKARRGLQAVQDRIPAVEADVARLSAALEGLQRTDPSTLEQLAEELLQAPTGKRPSPGSRKPGKRDARREPYHVFQNPAGDRIYVGRSARDNDRLTFGVARGRDAWLHARDVTGAHVVLRLDRGGEPNHESLLDAACLAKHYSDARGEDQADISWTYVKYVRRSRTPGQVYLASAKTLRVGTDPERLQRLRGHSPGLRIAALVDPDPRP